MRKFKPTTTDEQFCSLHVALDTTRKSSKTVKVDRQALANLLIDHGQLWKGVQEIA